MEKTVSSARADGKAGATCKSVKVEHALTLRTKINAKQCEEKRLQYKTRQARPPRENGQTFSHVSRSSVLGQSARAVEMKAGDRQTHKWELIKLKGFFSTAKETIKQKTAYRLGGNVCKRCD